MRSVSQSLYIDAYGARALPIVVALGPVGLIALICGYARLLSWLGPKRAMIATSFFSAGVILLCFDAIRGGIVGSTILALPLRLYYRSPADLQCATPKVATGVLYVFRESYIVLLVEQIWAFINSTVRTDEGRRLNGPICGVASLGAIAGGVIVSSCAVKLGSVNLLVLAAASLLPTGLLAALAYHIGGEPAPPPEEAGGKRGHLGLGLLFRSRLLGTLALLIAATQIVSTLFDLQLSRYVEQAIQGKDQRTEWFGGFYAFVNVGSAVFQFVGAPLLLHYVSPIVLQLAIPVVHATMCAASLAHPSLLIVAAPLYVFKVLDYSVFRASKELLYIPLSFDARYRAKELIDAFAYRAAKGGTGVVLAVASGLKSLPLAAYSTTALAILVGWLALVIRLASAWRAQSVRRE